MLAHMKPHPIEKEAFRFLRHPSDTILIYVMPTMIFGLDDATDDEDGGTVSPEEVFGDLFEKYGKAGALLGGLRYSEGLTQREFAKILNITQANLSAMENGKRTIGKELAKRIEAKFKLDYRMFL